MTTGDNEYVQVERRFTDDHWRATTYEGPGGHRVHVALPPRNHFADYGNGRVFLDHRSYSEEAEQSMLTRLVAEHGTTEVQL